VLANRLKPLLKRASVIEAHCMKKILNDYMWRLLCDVYCEDAYELGVVVCDKKRSPLRMLCEKWMARLLRLCMSSPNVKRNNHVTTYSWIYNKCYWFCSYVVSNVGRGKWCYFFTNFYATHDFMVEEKS
jgi:hypothetical protein